MNKRPNKEVELLQAGLGLSDPIVRFVDLDNFFTDIHKYLRFLDEALIHILLENIIENSQ